MTILTPIGRVASDAGDTSEIKIDDAYAAGLRGLDGFSHMYVIYYIDDPGEAPPLVSAPRPDAPAVGIFAQRDQRHPNGIGVEVVEIFRVEETRVTVRGLLGAPEGTPVLDLKPYVARDCVEGAVTPRWPG